MAKWTPEDDARLKELYETGAHTVSIALELGRSTTSVSQRISATGLAKAKRKESREKPKTEPKPKPEPLDPSTKGRYKIRYLVDGVEERTASVMANDERRAKLGLLKELEKQDPLRSFDIIRVESFEPLKQDPIKTFKDFIENGGLTMTDESQPSPGGVTAEEVKEIQEGIEEKFGHVLKNKKDPEELNAELVAKHEKFLDKEEEEEMEERRINPSFEQQQSAPVSIDNKMRLVLFGKPVSEADTKEIIEFIKKVAPLLEVV